VGRSNINDLSSSFGEPVGRFANLRSLFGRSAGERRLIDVDLGQRDVASSASTAPRPSARAAPRAGSSAPC